MRFWDSSALVPLLLLEPATQAVVELLRADLGMIVWWSSPVECALAIARLEREDALDRAGVAEAFDRLDTLTRSWAEVTPTRQLRDVARRLLRVHSLRAADALQLAAAYVASEMHPATLSIVTLDDRLRDAADREGFQLVGG